MYCKQCNLNFVSLDRPRLFCSLSCQSKHASHVYYVQHKEQYLTNARRWEKQNPERRKEIKKKAMAKFLENNRERFNELMRIQYRKNTVRCNERKYVNLHREKIVSILGTKCSCGAEMQELHHKKYEGLPRKNIVEYCKWLEPLCRDCHKKIKFKGVGKNKQWLSLEEK